MSLHLTEERPGYFRADRVHPVTGARMVKKGADQLVLLQWAREVDRAREELSAGLISREQACTRLLVKDAQRFTVRDAWEAFFPTILHSGTRRAYAAAWEQRLREPFGDMALEQLTDEVLSAWFVDQLKTNTTRGRQPSTKTLDNAWQCLKAAVRRQVGKRIDRLPWNAFTIKIDKHHDLPTEREALRSFEEFERLIRGAAEEDAHLIGAVPGTKFADLAPRVGVLLMTGMRSGEGAALGFDDVESRSGVPYLNIRHAVTEKWRTEHPEWDRPKDPPKNGRALIPIHADVAALIEYQRAQLMALGWYRPDGPIFPGKGGKWRDKPRLVDPDRMRELVKKYVPEANWKEFVTHSTRHSFATVISVAMQGDEKRAMQLTRHRDESVFRSYRHMAGRGLVENPLPRTDAFQGLPQSAKQLPPHEYPKPDVWDPNADAAENVLTAGIAAIVAVTPERAAQFEAQQREERRRAQAEIGARYKASNATDFETAWRHWTAAGRPGERPYQVTAAMTHAYDRQRKAVLRADKTGRRNVQKNERSWETIVRHALAIPVEKEVPGALVDEIKRLNEGRDKPPTAGNTYTVPVEWEARKRARASRRAVLMAWANFLKKRDGMALRRGECTDANGAVRYVEGWSGRTQTGQVAGQQEEPHHDGQEAAPDDE